MIKGELAQSVNELKQQEGNSLLVLGSGALVPFLANHDLIDECELWIHPVIVGEGEHLSPTASTSPCGASPAHR